MNQSKKSDKMVGKPENKETEMKKERAEVTADSGTGKVDPQQQTPRMSEHPRHGHAHGHGGPQHGSQRTTGNHNDRDTERDFGTRGRSQGPVRGGGRGVGGGDDSFGRGSRGMGRGRGRGGDRNERGQFHLDQPQVSLDEAMPPSDKKFTGRCRLFVGNLPTDTSEDDFKAMFAEHGEFTEVFLNPSRGFGFIRMDYRKNAEAAKAALDGMQRKGRTLRVRFATHGAALKVKYIPPHVSNELLAQAFSIFGELERAVIIVDDRGKPTGDGVVEFARKPGAQAALRRISEGVFMLGMSPRPIVVEPLEQKDDEDGYAEKFIQKTPEINKEREQPPRFAPQGSFEFDFGQKWKDLFHIHEEQKMSLQREFEAAIAKLEIEQAGAQMEHQTQMLRQDLLRRQEELRRLEEMHQMELQKRMDVRHQEDQRRRQEEERRREEMSLRRQQQEERRQQELYVQQRAMREMRGDQLRSDQMRSDQMRSDQMRGDQMRGDQMRGDQMRGDQMRTDRGQNAPMQPPPAPPAGLGVERGRQGVKQGGHSNMGNMDSQDDGHGNGFGGDMHNPPLG